MIAYLGDENRIFFNCLETIDWYELCMWKSFIINSNSLIYYAPLILAKNKFYIHKISLLYLDCNLCRFVSWWFLGTKILSVFLLLTFSQIPEFTEHDTVDSVKRIAIVRQLLGPNIGFSEYIKSGNCQRYNSIFLSYWASGSREKFTVNFFVNNFH